MKDFFKSVLATVVGIFISCIILGLISTLLFFGFVAVVSSSASSSAFTLKDNTVLTINLSGEMQDRVIENPLLQYLGLEEVNQIALTDILSAIKKAKDDDKISGIYIKSGYLSASSASLNEIRKELENFKTSGKFIVVYGDNYLQGCYFLTSLADKIILNPQGSVDLHGLALQRTFYKDLLDKIGVEMQVFKVGTYKSAVEPYMLDKMSDANREQVTSYANDMWLSMLTKISSSRNISMERLNLLADTLPLLRGSDFAIENHLADTLLYETEVKKYLKSLLDVKESDDLNTASVSEILSVPSIEKTKSKDKVAILYAEGSIVSGNEKTDINDRYLIKQIGKLQDNDDIKAVVFRVNSPGGSAYASEQIWKAISDLKEKKPVVVSMGDYAASGGYYISCNASKIYAQPNTLTGSIGIFGIFPDVSGLTNKIGLKFDHVKTNKMSDFGDVSRPMNDDEKAILQAYIEKGYDLFLTRCSDGRGIPKDSLDRIAQGRVWTGKQALGLGLVDALGGIDDAVKDAARMAELEDYSISEYPRKITIWETFLNINQEEIASRIVKEYIGEDFELVKTIKEIKNLKEQDFVQARMPYDLELK